MLQLFVHLLTCDPSYINLKHTLQEKFLLMDSSSLASWLEKILLGYTAQSAVGNLLVKDILLNGLLCVKRYHPLSAHMHT